MRKRITQISHNLANIASVCFALVITSPERKTYPSGFHVNRICIILYSRIRKQQSDIYHIYSLHSTIHTRSCALVNFHFRYWKEIPHSEWKIKILYLPWFLRLPWNFCSDPVAGEILLKPWVSRANRETWQVCLTLYFLSLMVSQWTLIRWCSWL